jgi:divalent metal cation (Fe/Co/Zn/Cd) transporter
MNTSKQTPNSNLRLLKWILAALVIATLLSIAVGILIFSEALSAGAFNLTAH